MSTPVPPATAKEAAGVEYLTANFPQSLLDPEDTHFFTGDCYLRFVRAADGDTAVASKALEEVIAWRKSYKPYAIDPVKACPKALNATFLNLGGVTKAGFGIVVMTLAKPNEADMEERLRLLYATFESLAQKGREYFVIISDFSCVGKGTKDPEGQKTRDAMMESLQKYYPERNQTFFMYNPPWFISTFFPMVALRMDSKTKERTKGNQKTKDLLKYIDEAQLPKELGGKFEMAANVVEALGRIA